MIGDALEIARQSYGRCALKKGFFEGFYDTFMGSSPQIPPFFASTDMTKQRGLLREGISYMLLYSEGSEGGMMAIERIAKIHDIEHVNVKPELYKLWVQSLISNIRKFDHRYTDEVERAWEQVLQQGIQRFVDLYHP